MGRARGALALPRAERLRGGSEIQGIFEHGHRIDRRLFLTLWRPGTRRRVAFAVSRQVRPAARRNRVRRRLREAFRQNRPAFPGEMTVVFVARPSSQSADFSALLREMRDVAVALGAGAGAVGPRAPRRRT